LILSALDSMSETEVPTFECWAGDILFIGMAGLSPQSDSRVNHNHGIFCMSL
jgi:hypothetical protein